MIRFLPLRALGLLAVVALAGCTSFKSEPFEQNSGRSVDFNKENVAKVGDVLLLEFEYSTSKGAILTEQFEQYYGLTKVSAPAGQALIPYAVDGKPGYCTVNGIFRNMFGKAFIKGCFFDRDGDQKFESLLPLYPDNWGEKDITPVPYKAAEVKAANKGYQSELVYAGITGNKLDIIYFEFSGDRKQQRLRHPLEFPLAPNGVAQITHRGASITATVQMAGADKGSMRYVVRSGFAR